MLGLNRHNSQTLGPPSHAGNTQLHWKLFVWPLLQVYRIQWQQGWPGAYLSVNGGTFEPARLWGACFMDWSPMKIWTTASWWSVVIHASSSDVLRCMSDSCLSSTGQKKTRKDYTKKTKKELLGDMRFICSNILIAMSEFAATHKKIHFLATFETPWLVLCRLA